MYKSEVNTTCACLDLGPLYISKTSASHVMWDLQLVDQRPKLREIEKWSKTCAVPFISFYAPFIYVFVIYLYNIYIYIIPGYSYISTTGILMGLLLVDLHAWLAAPERHLWPRCGDLVGQVHCTGPQGRNPRVLRKLPVGDGWAWLVSRDPHWYSILFLDCLLMSFVTRSFLLLVAMASSLLAMAST